jgi:hypothetical protein
MVAAQASHLMKATLVAPPQASTTANRSRGTEQAVLTTIEGW